MHVNISEEPLFTEIFRKTAAPEPRTTLCASLRSRNALQHFTREHFFMEVYRKNAAAQNLGPHFARVCALEMHFNISQQPLIRKFTGKMLGSEPRTTLCASLRSRNALRYFTRATSYGNLEEKCSGPESGHPDQAPAFTPTVRTPQCGHAVWGKKVV